MSDGEEEKTRPVVEWVFGIASAAIVTGLIAFLAREALFGDARPPDLVASVERLAPVENGTLVMIVVANRGDETAAEVGVRASVGNGDGAIAKDIVFDYVPARSLRRGAFVIEGRTVGREAVSLSVAGFVEP